MNALFQRLAAALIAASLWVGGAADAAPSSFVPVGNERSYAAYKPTGGTIHRLTNGDHVDATFYATYNTWHSSGRYIFFESDRPAPPEQGGGANDLQVMAVDRINGELYWLTSIPAHPGRRNNAMEFHANYNATFDQIFLVDRAGFQIHRFDVPSGSKSVVYEAPEGFVIKQAPRFSAQSNRVAFTLREDTADGPGLNGYTYHLMVGDTGRVGTFTGVRSVKAWVGTTGPDVTLNHVEWNPKINNLISFKADAIYTIRSDGADLKRAYPFLGGELGWRDHHSWSPDGRKINYVENGGLGRWHRVHERYWFYRSGLEPPAWHQDMSPDGGKIVYDTRSVRRRDRMTPDGFGLRTGNIAWFDVASGRSRTIAWVKWGDHPRHPHPQFAPSGDWVAFTDAKRNGSRIAMVEAK